MSSHFIDSSEMLEIKNKIIPDFSQEIKDKYIPQIMDENCEIIYDKKPIIIHNKIKEQIYIFDIINQPIMKIYTYKNFINTYLTILFNNKDFHILSEIYTNTINILKPHYSENRIKFIHNCVIGYYYANNMNMKKIFYLNEQIDIPSIKKLTLERQIKIIINNSEFSLCHDDNKNQCMICLENQHTYQDLLKCKKCNNTGHIICMTKNIIQNATCPYCRNKVNNIMPMRNLNNELNEYIDFIEE